LRRRSDLLIKTVQHVRPGGRVADSQHFADIGVEAIASRFFEDGAQRGLQSNTVGGLFANGDVCR